MLHQAGVGHAVLLAEGFPVHPSKTSGTHTTWQPRPGLGAVRPQTPALDGAGEAATLWEGLSAELIGGVPALLDEVGLILGPVAPEYAEFVVTARPEVVVAAEAAMVAFVEHAQRCPAPITARAGAASALLPDTVLAMFDDVGRNQCAEGYALRTLLWAYQVGGRVAWHHVAATALKIGIGAEALAALAEAVFLFVDELCAASTDGYVAAQTASVAEREHRLDTLVELLLSDRSDSTAVQEVASRAGWVLPQRATVVFTQPEAPDTARQILTRLGPHCLPIRTTRLAGVIVPDADAPGRRAQLTTVLRGHGAVVGADVPLAQLPASARLAEAAADLARTGVLTQDPVFVEEHLDAVIVHHDPHLLDVLRQQCLAPLAKAAPASRPMLQDTLRSWLRHMGDRGAVAEELHVHRQTVRYRLNRLHDLYGPPLTDPDTRARLLLVLAWDPTTEAGPPENTRT